MIPVRALVSDEAQQWDGWGTALKPAWESICIGYKRVDLVNLKVEQEYEMFKASHSDLDKGLDEFKRVSDLVKMLQ